MMIVLIPAFEPDQRLVQLVRDVLNIGPDVRCVVVDDGSHERHEQVFRAAAIAGAHVITQHPNRGKGAAMKFGFQLCMQRFPGESVVCADCDGQHTVQDISRVMQELAIHADEIVLGVRAFAGKVPLRSRIGNAVTTKLFAAATRTPIADTQTGLRGYPAAMLPWLVDVPGERFEYELSVLLQASREGIPVREVGIHTIYLERNATSHFRPLQDSARIYWPLLKFAASSLLAFAVDTAVLLLLHAMTGTVVFAAIAARAISASMNFTLNRRIVFRDTFQQRIAPQIAQYWLLVLALLLVNVTLLKALLALGLPLLLAKLCTEALLFFGSFSLQHSVIFARRERPVAASASTESVAMHGQ